MEMTIEFMEYKWTIKIIENHARNIKDNTYSYGPFEDFCRLLLYIHEVLLTLFMDFKTTTCVG